MASAFVLFISLLLFASASVEARGNIEWGLSEDYNLAYHQIHDATSIPLTKRTESVLVRVSQDEKIEAIRVYDLIGDSTSAITKQGEYFVVIDLESARGEPFRFLIEVYAVRK